MKTALIPPIPELDSLPSTGIHLLLSHLCSEPAYLEHYLCRRNEGDYLILDNSAHENGIGHEIKTLFNQARQLGAQEVVLPDVLFDSYATVEKTGSALDWLSTREGEYAYGFAGDPNVMIVPQGGDRADWARCLKKIIDLWKKHELSTWDQLVIGISKDYDYFHGGLTRLIKDYVAPLKLELNFEVHILGWPNNLWSLAQVKDKFPWVRSTDTAKAHVYARNGILLEPGGEIPAYPRRRKNYFFEPFTPAQLELARRNVEVFKAAANSELILG